MLQHRYRVTRAFSQSCLSLFSTLIPENLYPQPELGSLLPISWFPEAAVFVLQLIVVIVVMSLMGPAVQEASFHSLSYSHPAEGHNPSCAAPGKS